MTDFVSNSSSSSFVIELDKPLNEYSESEFIRLFQTGRGLSELYKMLHKYDPFETKFFINVGDSDEDVPGLEEQLRDEYYGREFNNCPITSYESHH